MSVTILVVEDSPTQREALVQILREAGYRVVEAQDGVEGLELAKIEGPDLILTDIEMPRRNGYELIQTLVEDPKTADIPVIILSSLDSLDAVLQGYAVGANGFLSKTDESPETILGRVQDILRLKSHDRRAAAAPATLPPITLFDRVSFGVALLDLHRQLIYANEKARALLDIDRGEDLRRADNTRLKEVLRQVESSPQGLGMLQMIQVAGSHVQLRVEEHRGPEGKIEGVILLTWKK